MNALILFCFASHLIAAPFTLKEAIEAAKAKTESGKIQDSIVEQRVERISQAAGRLLPTVSLLANYQRQQEKPGLGAFARPEQYTARINLTQPLFRGFGEYANWRAEEASLESQLFAKEMALIELQLNVARSYFGVLIAESDLENYKTLQKLTQERLTEMKNRVKIGRSRKGEYLAVLSQKSLVESQIEQATGTLLQAQETLHFTTGLPLGTELAPIAEKRETALAPIDTFLKRIEKRPDIQYQASLEKLAREATNAARAGHYPTLDASFNYYLLRGGSPSDAKWDVGIIFAFPLFQGGTTQSAIREALEREKTEELRTSLLKRSAIKEVRAAYANLQSLTRQHQSLKEASSVAMDNYREQLRDYQHGLSNHLDVLQALNSVEETERNRDHISLLTILGRLELDLTVGEIHL